MPGGAQMRARLEALLAAARAVADGPDLMTVLQQVVEAASAALDAEVVGVRILDPDGVTLETRAVSAASPAVAAELEGSRLDVEEVDGAPGDDESWVPRSLRALADRAGADVALLLPVRARGSTIATVEVLRRGPTLDEVERIVARLVVDQVGMAIRTFPPSPDGNGARGSERTLAIAGEALAVGIDSSRVPDEVARVAADASRARAARVWGQGGDELAEVGVYGEAVADVDWMRLTAAAALEARAPVSVAEGPDAIAITLPLGQPPSLALQLLFAPGEAPESTALPSLVRFAVRAAAALRDTERSTGLAHELERTRTLLSVMGQVTAELSISRTLETFVARIAELLDVERVGVYLREGGRLVPAAERGLAGPHAPVAERLLELALARARGRGVIVVESAGADPRLAPLRGTLAETGIETAVAVPLRVPDEVTGLLAIYPARRRRVTANEEALLAALAAQVAVALQNASLHERATRLGAELEAALAAERQTARERGALYEISRSFAQTLELDTTQDAVVRTVAELLEVDAAVIRTPDARGELLVPTAQHVADAALAPAIAPILARPQSVEKLPGRRLFRMGKALLLDADSAESYGPPHDVLVPFLGRGATAVVLPIATPQELLGTLTLLSLDPEKPISDETIELALMIAGQAALAIDNARLYQQQKAFADTMQRSLLPRSRPDLPGLDVGAVYESSARVDVGGDIYDFLRLEDGRLAVVIGDVTGHGIDAAADMAMAKFVFRSLAREHPEPAGFLAAANAVVCGEIGGGKFITMLYLTLDPATGALACAGAGHPEPRLVLPDGGVEGLRARGLALGIESEQAYDEVRAEVPRGAGVVLYTDGVIEARRGTELYGTERLDAAVAAGRELPAAELARAILDDCRGFAGGELADDCAVVVIKRTADRR